MGTVISIVNFGASDLINVKKDNRNNFYIPINEENIKKIDVKKKIIVATIFATNFTLFILLTG